MYRYLYGFSKVYLSDWEVLEDNEKPSDYYIYEGYPEFLPETRLSFPLNLNPQGSGRNYKWGLFYMAPIVRMATKSFVILGETDKWVHVSPKVSFSDSYFNLWTI